MTANDSKSYLNYLDKLVDQYNNNYHILLIASLLVLIILLWMKQLRPIIKAPKFKVNDRVRITKYKNIYSKSYNFNLTY